TGLPGVGFTARKLGRQGRIFCVVSIQVIDGCGRAGLVPYSVCSRVRRSLPLALWLLLEFGLEAILGAMGLVGNDNNVAAVRQHWEGVFVFPRHEFLDSGKHNATR